VHAAKQPSFSIDELYWATRKLQAFEAWAAHGEWISVKGRRIGQAIYDRFAFGSTVSAVEVIEETRRRDAFRVAFGDLLGEDGILVLPTVPCAAPLAASSADEKGAFRERAIRLLCWSGLSGFPQISLPLGSVDGAPFGISLLGPAGSDMALIRLGRRVLEASGKA
jgi:amidase